MKEKTIPVNKKAFFILNAVIQILIIFLYVNYGLIWPLYFVIGALCIIIFSQTIVSAAIFAKIHEIRKPNDYTREDYSIAVLNSLIYASSCYTLFIAGFIGFAWFAAAHVAIMFFTNLFGAFKK